MILAPAGADRGPVRMVAVEVVAVAEEPVVAELDQRKQRILRAIVTEYVAAGEPVGSARVVAVARLDCSAATVRNEMAVLDELGLIRAPHTSAGRVPTDAGYRAFVEMLRATSSSGTIESSQRELVGELLSSATDVDDLLARTTSVLSQLTRLVSLVIAPVFDDASLKLVELVSLGPHSALLLLVSDTGSVTKRVLELGEPTGEDDIARVRVALQDRLVGRSMSALAESVSAIGDEAPTELRGVLSAIAAVAASSAADEAVHRMLVSGRASLATEGLARGDLSRVLALLDEQSALARVLDTSSGEGTTPVVRIGQEHDLADLESTSLVAQRYRLVSAGAVGVLGPTRMDYVKVLATVGAVAEQLQATLAKMSR